MKIETKKRFAGNANWHSKKANFKAKFPLLTDDDLYQNDRQSMEKLQHKLGMTSDELCITIMSL